MSGHHWNLKLSCYVSFPLTRVSRKSFEANHILINLYETMSQAAGDIRDKIAKFEPKKKERRKILKSFSIRV
jgi:hypothetical protein